MNDKTQLRVVVVDDSDYSRLIIREMLAEEGIQVVGEAASAEAGLLAVREKKPHVVITDIVMPDVSGIELTEKISQSFDEVSVIVISSLAQEHVVLEAIRAGATDFIAKPIQKQQLLDSLEKILEQNKG